MKYLDILKEQPNRLRFILSRILRMSGLYRLFRIQRDGYSLLLHPASISMSLWVNKNERSEEGRLIRSLLGNGDTYVDVGANIGQLAIEAALAVGDNGKVMAIEAHPRIAQYLRDNIAYNKLSNVLVGQFAAGDRCGWTYFSDTRSDDQNKVSAKSSGLTVPMIPLEKFINDKKVNLLKIDVEGYEKFVLIGLGKAIENIDIIYFESFDKHYDAVGYKFSDIFDILEKHGFNIVSINESGIHIVTRNHSSPQCENLLAYCNDKYLQDKIPALQKILVNSDWH